MKKISKRKSLLNQLILKKIYSLDESFKLLKALSSAKFIESVEAHFVLNINTKKTNQQIRTNLLLPYGTGKKLRVAAFVENDIKDEILNYGAILAGYENVLEAITTNKINFDLLITKPNLISHLTKLGRILGPKGMMPSLKLGTITNNLKETIDEFNKGKIEYKTDKTGIVHVNFGKITFSEKELKENFLTLYNSINKNKPLGVKGKYIKACYICTTMSPSIKLDLQSFNNC